MESHQPRLTASHWVLLVPPPSSNSQLHTRQVLCLQRLQCQPIVLTIFSWFNETNHNSQPLTWWPHCKTCLQNHTHTHLQTHLHRHVESNSSLLTILWLVKTYADLIRPNDDLTDIYEFVFDNFAIMLYLSVQYLAKKMLYWRWSVSAGLSSARILSHKLDWFDAIMPSC